MPKVISRAGKPTGVSAEPKPKQYAPVSNDTVLVLLQPNEEKFEKLLHNILPNVPLKVVHTWKLPPLQTICGTFNKIVTTRKDVLQQITYRTDKSVTPYNFAGSLIPYANSEFLILDGLYQLPYKAEYNVLCRQYCRKLIEPEIFPPYKFEPYTYHNGKTNSLLSAERDILKQAYASELTAFDVETKPFEIMPDGSAFINVLTVVGFSFFLTNPDGSKRITSHSINIDTPHALALCKEICATPAPKIAHGGKYDAAWSLRWNIPLVNLVFDTMHEMHTLYHDFRKSLAHVGAFTCREYIYWKDERKAEDLEDRLHYNAKDCHYTLVGMLFFMMHSPEHTRICVRRKAKRLMYAVRTGMLGFNTCEDTRLRIRKEFKGKADKALNILCTITGQLNYNPNSSPQTKKLLEIIALSRINVTSSDDKQLREVQELDNFCSYMVSLIKEYRKNMKTVNAFLDAHQQDGRMLTSLDVVGTTSDRWASKLSDFWHAPEPTKKGDGYKKPKSQGFAVMTVKEEAREFIIADEGMTLFSCDLPSAEAFFVQKLSGDPTLGKVLYSDDDYHSFNASMFFGVPYEEIYDNLTKKKLNKKLRDLAKRVNHGSNYNMGPVILLDTMGYTKVVEAQVLLGLQHLTPIAMCTHLLQLFRDTYPYIKGGKGVMIADSWYGRLKDEVNHTGKVTCPDGYVKYVMGNPKNKLVMNNLASVKPQHLSAEYLHQGMEALIEEHGAPKQLEVLAPIHDELFGQVRKGTEEYYAPIIQDAMTIDFDMGDSILRIKPDEPVFGHHWSDVH